MQPELIIFDCDGVLIDSELLSNQTEIEVFEEFGVHYELHAYMARFVGKSSKDATTEWERDFGGPLPASFRPRLDECLAAAFERELRAMPGIHDFLDRLETRVCVASSSSPARLALTLGLVGLSEYFGENIFSATMVTRGKPEPDIFLYTAAQMGVDPGACVVIEDSALGATGAVAAGMRTIGFVGGSHCTDKTREDLLRVGVEAVAETHLECANLIHALEAGRPVRSHDQ
ncbi:MAG: HAD family hydrolase [Armatimonadetes bacterium]|nr:HAD family hydrolase [Armatimonadota bacterium]